MASKKQQEIEQQVEKQIQRSQIIELREQSRFTDRRENGDYMATLDKTIIINPLDQIQIKSCFIDTVAQSSNLIPVPPDVPGGSVTTITIKHGLFIQDWGSTYEINDTQNPSAKQSKVFIPDTQNQHPTDDLYILSTRITNTNGFDFLGFEFDMIGDATDSYMFKFDLLLRVQHPDDNQAEDHVMSFDFTKDIGLLNQISETIAIIDDGHNAISRYRITSKVLEADGGVVIKTDFKFPLKTVSNGAHIVVPTKDDPIYKNLITPKYRTTRSFTDPAGTTYTEAVMADGGQYIANADAETIVPKQFDLVFEIPSNERGYDPQKLTEIITRKATSLTSNGPIAPTQNINPINSTLLTTTEQIKADNGGQSPFFVRTDGQKVFNYNPASLNYLIGTSQFGLEYDDVSQKMEFSQIHSSLYNEKGLTVIKVVKSKTDQSVNPNVPAKISYCNKHSGIFFFDLQPRSLWIDSFKFDNSIFPQFTNTTFAVHDLAANISVPVTTLTDGIHITGESLGLDAIVIKQNTPISEVNNAGYNAFDVAINPLAGSQGIVLETVVQTTTSITSRLPIFLPASDDDSQGYFQVEISGLVPSDISGKEHFNNKIQAIISRYYSGDNFTSSYNEGSIPYQHNSPSAIELSRLGVRILNPDGTLAKVGNRNAVFIEIIKSGLSS